MEQLPSKLMKMSKIKDFAREKLNMSRKNNHTKAERIIGREYRIPSSPLFTHHLVAISASHRKGRPCLAGAPGSGSSSPHCSRNNDHCALQCSAASPSLCWMACSGPGPVPHTPADQHRGAQNTLTFLLSVPAKKRWERKERGTEQRAGLTGGCLMVLV